MEHRYADSLASRRLGPDMAEPPADWPRDGLALLARATNGLGIAAAAVFAGAGVARPNYSKPPASAKSLIAFWSASSAVRTWALTLGYLTPLARGERPSSDLLRVAGLVQLGDSALGIWQRNPRMAVFPALMGLVHLRCARSLMTAGPSNRAPTGAACRNSGKTTGTDRQSWAASRTRPSLARPASTGTPEG